MTYDEYRALGGKLSSDSFLANIQKAKGYVSSLSRKFNVTYADDNLDFALVELVDSFQQEIESESDTLSFTSGSYSEKTVKSSKSVNFNHKRYEIASRYLEISRAMVW